MVFGGCDTSSYRAPLDLSVTDCLEIRLFVMQYVMRELLTVPITRVEIIVRTSVIATASLVDNEAIEYSIVEYCYYFNASKGQIWVGLGWPRVRWGDGRGRLGEREGFVGGESRCMVYIRAMYRHTIFQWKGSEVKWSNPKLNMGNSLKSTKILNFTQATKLSKIQKS